MAILNPNAYYREKQVTTASRGQLLLMAYDGMLRFLAEGQRAMQDRQYEAQGKSITRVQDIITELMYSLDHSACPEVAASLEKLYRYMYDRLTTANVYDDEQALQEVMRMLTGLRETWYEADRMVRCQETTPAPTGTGGFAA